MTGCQERDMHPEGRSVNNAALGVNHAALDEAGGPCGDMEGGLRGACFDVVTRRKSTRNFTREEVRRELIDRVLEAARWAPSSKNRQPWRYMVISSACEIDRICDMLEAKTDDVYIAATSGVIRSASTLILVGRDSGAAANDALYDYLSIGASVQNMLLAATEIGLGSLWICDILEIADEIKSEFAFEHELVSAVCLGYEDKYGSGRTRKGIGEIAEYRDGFNQSAG